MKRKGFTLVELLVVIAIIALLMGILMPALARVRQLAFRMTCGSNLAGIGKAMLIYANDYDDELPRSGSRTSVCGQALWNATNRVLAYGLNATDGLGGKVSISSSFYLLVKYAEVTPKSFLCKGDTGVSEFTLSGEQGTATITELTQAWDFGATPATKCSYSYHLPVGTTALTTTSEPGFAVAADRNPFLPSPSDTTGRLTFVSADGKRTFNGKSGSTDDQTYSNSTVHQEDGQNVMFLDTHVEFCKRAYCSLEDDNIYTPSSYAEMGDPKGVIPVTVASVPRNRKDSLLFHEPPAWGGGTVVRR